jgi:hypothetical protein
MLNSYAQLSNLASYWPRDENDHHCSAPTRRVTLSYYEELKLHLMLGDHVEAIVNTKECESFAGFPRDYDLIFGHTMQNYKILNEGTPVKKSFH